MTNLFLVGKKDQQEFVNYANLAFNAKNVIIGELENKIDVVKVTRDKNEKIRCKKIEEELSKQLLILKNEMYIIREQKEDVLNILERIKSQQEEIDFYKADQYYSYRANIVVLENFKGETTKGSKVIIELAGAVEKKEFKKFGLIKEKLADNEKCYLVVFNNFKNDPNDLFFKFESILRIEYDSNSDKIMAFFNRHFIIKFSLIEWLISNIKLLNEQGKNELNSFDIFKDAKIETYPEIWAKCKKDFFYKEEDYQIKNESLLSSYKENYLTQEELPKK